jgi:catechol 2,3-dioxygenase-like lactoylglutathione lyase family enzyme
MILQLLYVGFAVESVDCTRRTFRRLFGLPGERMEADTFLGTDKGARIAFPNECWLYVMESSQPQSPIHQFLEARGPGLERVAFLTDDIAAELDRVRRAGVKLSDDAVIDTPTGRRFAVPAEYVSGITVELVQPSAGDWDFQAPPSISGVLGLQHIGVATRDLEATCTAFARMFDLQPRDLRTDQHGGDQKDVMIEPGNDRLWLHVTESWGENARVRQFLDEKGDGLEHLCIEVDDIREAVNRVTGAGVRFFQDKIFTNRPDGFEAFAYPEFTTGVTVELIEPYPTSRGYRPRTGAAQLS